MKYIHEIIKICIILITSLAFTQCSQKNEFSEILTKGKWQIWQEDAFHRYQQNVNGINNYYNIYKDDYSYGNYFLNSKNTYPNFTGKWEFSMRDSILYMDSIIAKIKKYNNDTIYANTNIKHFENVIFIKLKDANKSPHSK